MAVVVMVLVILGYLILFIAWAIHLSEISREADEKRANEIADEILENAEIRVIQRLEIIDEMQ